MSYLVRISKKGMLDLAGLPPSVRSLLERRIAWLAENAEVVIHHALQGMPDDLTGLCKFRVGDYRVLYWRDNKEQTLSIYRVLHRSEAYRHF